MPPKKAAPKKQSEILEEEANKMESIMSMLRGQIEEERSKVQPKKGTRWTAAAEGPIGKFDPHGKLARQILTKKAAKKPSSPSEISEPSSVKQSPRSKSEKSVELPQSAAQPKMEASVKPPTPKKTTSTSSATETSSPAKRGKIEIVVEPQGGKLWGQYMADNAIQPDENAGALWGKKTTECSVQPDEPPREGSLWGPPPDESAEAAKFKEEVAKFRGNEDTATSSAMPTAQEERDLPPIGAGGSLWGPPPDEVEEQQKFQREIARFRGEDLPLPTHPENESTAVGGNLVQKKYVEPTGFTYFDRLVTKNILDGTPTIQSNPPPKDE